MFEFISKFRQRLLILAIGLSVFLVSGQPFFSMAQDDTNDDGSKQTFLPMVSNGEAENSSSQELSPNDHAHFVSHRYDRFTGYGESWPPQPKGIENVVLFTEDEAVVSAASVQLAQAMEVASSTISVQSALGARFTHIATAAHSDKDSGANALQIVTYFSHSSNATIEAHIIDGGVAEIRQIPPSEYQPPLTVDEVDEAVAIARSFWLDSGIERVAELEGFGILGMLPTGATGFNKVRVVYVSFHVNEDVRPEYVGYVDLTNQTMLESWEE